MPLSKDDIDAAVNANERQRREDNATRRLLTRERMENERLEALVDQLTAIDNVQCSPAEWAQPKKRTKANRAVASLMLSDLHLDEVVDPGLMRGWNAYDREIALRRLQRLGAPEVRLRGTRA